MRSDIRNLHMANALICDGSDMAYPEPTPVITKKDAPEFFKRLDNFTLTPEQRRLYLDALRRRREGSSEPKDLWHTIRHPMTL